MTGVQHSLLVVCAWVSLKTQGLLRLFGDTMVQTPLAPFDTFQGGLEMNRVQHSLLGVCVRVSPKTRGLLILFGYSTAQTLSK
jgi:hypothetical protein